MTRWPGIWSNLGGRERHGCVVPEDYEKVRDSVIEALLDWQLPSGAPVVARALRREEIHDGPFTDRAPDIVIELALDDGHRLLRRWRSLRRTANRRQRMP